MSCSHDEIFKCVIEHCDETAQEILDPATVDLYEDRVDAALVLIGMKPASLVLVKDTHPIDELLDALPLPAKRHRNQPNWGEKRIVIAQSETLLEEAEDCELTDPELGRIYGYPEPMVEAYIERRETEQRSGQTMRDLKHNQNRLINTVYRTGIYGDYKALNIYYPATRRFQGLSHNIDYQLWTALAKASKTHDTNCLTTVYENRGAEKPSLLSKTPLWTHLRTQPHRLLIPVITHLWDVHRTDHRFDSAELYPNPESVRLYNEDQDTEQQIEQSVPMARRD